MINELCLKLKEKRNELGYSIEYVVEKTKLYPSTIRDIEECNLNKINPTYLKGFIKIYASFLGVDIKANLEGISTWGETIKKGTPIKKSGPDSIVNRIANTHKKIPPRFKKNIVIIFIGIVLLWIGFGIIKIIAKKASYLFKARPQKTLEKKEASPALNKTGSLSVSLTAKKKCFLKVIVDGKILFEGVLNKGTIEKWEGTRQIEIKKISDGSALQLEVNGKDIPTLTSMRKQIKSLKITPSGISVDR